MAAATVAVVAGPPQFCSNGQCLPIIIDPPVGGSDAGTTSGGMDAGTVGALDAGPSPLDTCTTDNAFTAVKVPIPPRFWPLLHRGLLRKLSVILRQW